MIKFIEKVYGSAIPRGITAVLGADIGGTNSNFGIFRYVENKPILLFSLHVKSQTITNFTDCIQELVTYIKSTYDITIKQALFAAAGVVSSPREHVKPTNLSLEIDTKDIKRALGLSCIYLVNDFEVIGYGLSLIDPKDIIQINKGIPREFGNKAIIGAGTGLGKCIMYWDRRVGRYIPVASEGGHADCAVQDEQELQLIQFIQALEQWPSHISWEDVLSGNGIQRIYNFFSSQQDSHDIVNEKIPYPDEIFKDRTANEDCRKTFTLYAKLYARCVKNFSLDSLALAGVYIAGGIAANNVDMFKIPVFMEEFVNCGKQGELLKELPVYVIADYNVSLYGAAQYLFLENVCDVRK